MLEGDLIQIVLKGNLSQTVLKENLCTFEPIALVLKVTECCWEENERTLGAAQTK